MSLAGDPHGQQSPSADAFRSDLLMALAAVCDTPRAAASAADALGLGAISPEEHTRAFILNCPPHAAIYLGRQGGLGGEGADRVAGFWRAIDLVPAADVDHLSSLLALLARLQSTDVGGRLLPPREEQALRQIRAALAWEHLWSWVPGYTRAMEDLGIPTLSLWARLTRRVLAAEVSSGLGNISDRLPTALRDAPPPPQATDELERLLDALVTPVRSGLVLTSHGLARAAATIGVGCRAGERRFALRAMLEQNVTASLAWLSGEAERWAARHRDSGADLASRWWATRASRTAAVTAELAARATSW
ncbi:MAG TPA: molecular chaperone TorD family protein [Acidimicrobiales bacterium]|nr:molecular chaperone TorD family protein [Acidimicrobiales bacterium]